VNTFFNKCDYRCYLADYDLYYCADSCSSGDVQLNTGEDCSDDGSKCCCTK